jgi:hypothetical protein
LSHPRRVLFCIERYGARALMVDSQGNGYYTTIQSAIDAANRQLLTDH